MNSRPGQSDLASLIPRCIRGETAAFGEIVRDFQDMALGYAYALLNDRQAAEDAVQEAFIAAWQLLPQLKDPQAFPAWFRRIVFKYCDRIRRAQSKHLPLEHIENEASPLPDPATTIEAAQLRALLSTAIAQLPAHEREAVLLHYIAGQSLAEIGRFLDLPSSTIKSRLFTARKKLKQRLIPLMEESVRDLRPSRDDAFASRVIKMIRPTDRELGESGGGHNCDGESIWQMMCAAVSGDANTIKALLQKDPQLATAEYWYTQPIHYAVREGHLAAVQALLDGGADPTHIRYGGEALPLVARDRGHEVVATLIETACAAKLGGAMQDHEIHTATEAEDLDKVRALITTDPGLLSRPNSNAQLPLHIAIQKGNLELVRFLLEAGANPNALTGSAGTYMPAHFSPLDFTVWKNEWWIWPSSAQEMRDLLLSHGAEYTITIAAAFGDTDRVEQLLAADPTAANRPQPSGRRPLSAAVQFGHEALVELLLQAGADPNLPEGRYIRRGSALYFAAKQKNHTLLDLLLTHGAQPGAGIDSCGNDYHVADELTRIKLYQHGLTPQEPDVTNVDALAIWASKDPDGLARTGCGTVFTMICKNEWFEDMQQKFPDEKKEAVLRMLLAMGVKVPPVVTGCRTYLWHKPKFARILLENGMDPNLPNWQWVTPLHDLCSLDAKGNPNTDRLELANFFLDFGADINARDEEYRSTPLAWAARNGLPDMVDLLLTRGASPQLPDDAPWATPLSWAQKRGHQEIAARLQAAGAKT